jgi:hypothetical protein
MPRIRSLKPEFWSDTRLSKLAALERLVFLCLWSMADDEGRIEGDADTVWRFGSFREDSREVAKALAALQRLSRIVLYEVDGNPYILVCNFLKHQRIDHASRSKLPPPSEGCDLLGHSSRVLASSREPSSSDQGAGSREQGGIPETSSPAGKPARKPVDNSPDPEKAELWRIAKGLLMREDGIDQERAGSIVGELVRDYGQFRVLAVVREAAQTQPASPHAWLRAACQERLAKGSEVPWWRSEEGTLAKAKDLNLAAKPGETMDAFRARIARHTGEKAA